MDQLQVHHFRQSKEAMEELKIEWVLNASYSLDFNPIELIFSQVKRRYRSSKLGKLAQGNQIIVEELVKSAF